MTDHTATCSCDFCRIRAHAHADVKRRIASGLLVALVVGVVILVVAWAAP